MMKLNITDIDASPIFRQLGITEDRMGFLVDQFSDFWEQYTEIDRAIVFKDAASICDTTEELLSVIDFYYCFQFDSYGFI